MKGERKEHTVSKQAGKITQGRQEEEEAEEGEKHDQDEYIKVVE
jgi:hypothetical protein